jgi:hypothetical protein
MIGHMTRIVTSTYRYKRPPGKRKPVEIEGPAVVTIDPKTRVAKKGSRETSPDEKAAAKVREASSIARPRTQMAGQGQSSTKPPRPANDDRKPPPPAGRKSAIVTVRDRKTVQRQREQQQMAQLMQGDSQPAILPNAGKNSAIVTARKPGKAIPDGWLPDTPEEHKRRGDAADALFREIVRRVAH